MPMSNQTNVKLRLDNSELWGGLIGLALGGFVIWSGLKLSFALDPLGFLLSSIPLMLLLLRVIDPVRWSLAVPIAVLVPLGMWWVLKRLLLIQLPSGTFEIG
jgi:hypothetical protein